MRTRDGVVEYQKVLSDSGTLIKDMDMVDPVSALYLEFQGTNGTTSNPDNFISDVITKIEIVDGSDVLYSLNLAQLEALHFFKLKQTPVLFPSDWPGGVQRHGCLLLFGRRLWDQRFAMDFRVYKNPQLKITSNLGAIRAAAADGAFVSGTLLATIVAKIMEEVPAPAEYLMAKQIDSFTSVTSGDKRVDMPTDHVYRMLMGRFWVEGEDLIDVITKIKMTCNVDKFIPFERYTKQLDAEALAQFGLIEYKHDHKQAYSEAWRVIPNMEPWASLVSRDPSVPLDWVQYAQWSSQILTEQYTAAGVLDGTARRVTSWTHGHAPHACLPVPFGDMDLPETWFDPTPYKKIELVLSQGKAATCEICLEQVRSLV